MHKWQATFVTTALALTTALSGALAGCADKHEQHYVSPQVQGANQRINLDEVQKAFEATRGTDFNTWMGNFEKRVNEIYDGKEIVSVDADRQNNYLKVTGFIENNNQPGFQNGEDKLFSIEQTGQAANDAVPYRVAGYDDRPYYSGYYHPSGGSFMEGLLLGHMMSNWGGHYYTPPQHVVVIHHDRDSWRGSSAYQSQQSANKSFYSRYKAKAIGGGFESNRKFGNGGFSNSGNKRRSWFNGGSSSSGDSGTSSGSSGSSWGGRRSSGSSWGSSSGSSSWSGRRSSSSGWGGRRRR